MRTNDRINRYVCTNADELDKVPKKIIGKTKNTQCFRLGTPLVPYFTQKNSSSDKSIFSGSGALKYFIPHIRKQTWNSIILLMNKYKQHGPHFNQAPWARVCLEQLKTVILTLNCTGKGQTIYMGIIYVLLYKELYLCMFVSVFSFWDGILANIIWVSNDNYIYGASGNYMTRRVFDAFWLEPILGKLRGQHERWTVIYNYSIFPWYSSYSWFSRLCR